MFCILESYSGHFPELIALSVEANTNRNEQIPSYIFFLFTF